MKFIATSVGILMLVLAGGAVFADGTPSLSLESKDGRNEIRFGIQLQPQYQFVSIEGHGKVNSFQIRRGRFIFSGHVFGEDLTYKLQFEAVGGRTTSVSPGVAYTGPNLRDAYINYKFREGLQVRAGQFKVYYNREELTHDYDLQFVDRSINNEVFGFDRQIGVALHGKPFDKELEYALYATNDGAGLNTANRGLMFLVGGRFLFNILGEAGYTISDLDGSEEPQLALAAAGSYNRLGAPTSPNRSAVAVTGDVIFRYKGFSLYGEGNFFRQYGPGLNTFGFLGETGYFIVPKKFEAALRYAGVIPTKGVTKGYEAGACLNYYFYGQGLKIQADYSYLMNGALVKGVGGAAGVNGPTRIVVNGGTPGFIQGENDHRARVQLQLYFD